ncbi:hypothetical protein [Neobacillus vireti]|uniref:hypothetical protein n=1 Tax=Neobacillus vireti TaxID=220686 RepID=UPI00128BBE20|nr:hypothetical protein [Neobacillus vireti]
MTHHITTGPMPGHPEACIAQYNHKILSHTPSIYHSNHHYSNHHFPNHNHLIPYIQQPTTGFVHYGIPSWRTPTAR